MVRNSSEMRLVVMNVFFYVCDRKWLSIIFGVCFFSSCVIKMFVVCVYCIVICLVSRFYGVISVIVVNLLSDMLV